MLSHSHNGCRFVLGEIAPRAASIFGAEQLPSQRINALRVGGGGYQVCRGVGQTRSARWKSCRWLGTRLGRLPRFVVDGGERFSRRRAGKKLGAIGRKPDVLGRAGGRRSQRQFDCRRAYLAPVRPHLGGGQQYSTERKS